MTTAFPGSEPRRTASRPRRLPDLPGMAAIAALAVAGCGGRAVYDVGNLAPLDLVATPTHPCGPPEAVGRVVEPAVTETSGLVTSARHPGVLWLHNDSGDTARLFAVALDGTLRGVALLDDTRAFDWEAMALGPTPDGEALFVADVGDNHHERRQVVIERLPEPPLGGTAAAPLRVPEPDHLELVYGDGVAHDAEAILVDRLSGDLLVLTKEFDGPPAIFIAEAPHRASSRSGRRGSAPPTLRRVGSVRLPPNLTSPLVTDAALSRRGDAVLVRTYGDVLLYRRRPGEPLVDALSRMPRSLPAPDERQGEAVTFLADGFVTVSEGEGPVVWRVPLCREPAPHGD